MYYLCYVWMEGNEGGVEGRGGERFMNLAWEFIFKWEGEGFEGIRRGKIPFQTPHF